LGPFHHIHTRNMSDESIDDLRALAVWQRCRQATFERESGILTEKYARAGRYAHVLEMQALCAETGMENSPDILHYFGQSAKRKRIRNNDKEEDDSSTRRPRRRRYAKRKKRVKKRRRRRRREKGNAKGDPVIVS
jgi:hypothetical protein